MSSARHPLPPVYGLLDVGNAKVVCLALAKDTGAKDSGAKDSGGGAKLLGVGHQKSRGIKAGVVVDPDAAEEAVRAAVAQAEEMSGETLGDVLVATASGRLTSVHVAAGLDLGGRQAQQADLDELLDAGRQYTEQNDRTPLHVNPVAFRLDGAPLMRRPIGAVGQNLSADLNVVAADRGPLQQVRHLIERCQLRVIATIPAPLASALAVTSNAEREEGTLVIDLGAGITGLALFLEGTLVTVHALPIGSNHITYDLSRALSTSLEEAERIKKKCAILSTAHSAKDDAITYQQRGDDHAGTPQVHTNSVTRADISTILTSRLDALLLQVLQRLEPLALAPKRCRGAVLTGGGSLLGGLCDHASRTLSMPVRLGTPLPHGPLPAALQIATFATASGLQSFATNLEFGGRSIAALPGHRMLSADVRQDHR